MAHYVVIHNGHRYEDGLHWIASCPLCREQMKVIEAMDKENGNASDDK